MKKNRCRYCGKMFYERTEKTVCNNCKKIDEAIFSKIEAYLAKYPNSNAIQIAEGIGIAAIEILRFVDEGRLQLSRGTFERLK